MVEMLTSENIFIASGYGTYSRTEFERCTNPVKLTLMESWFRERYEIPSLETIKARNHARPQAAHFATTRPPEELYKAFEGLAAKSLIEPLVLKLYKEGAYTWSAKSEYWDPSEKHQNSEPPGFRLGAEAERDFRDLVLGHLEKLEDLLIQLTAHGGMMGHNHPPEEISDHERRELDVLAAIIAETKAELKKPFPDVADVTPRLEKAIGIRGRLQNSVARKFDIATDEFAKAFGGELGKSLGKLVFWGSFFAALGSVIAYLERWLHALGMP